jgi:hypothetical protein
MKELIKLNPRSLSVVRNLFLYKLTIHEIQKIVDFHLTHLRLSNFSDFFD